jgi:hypothetical protein
MVLVLSSALVVMALLRAVYFEGPIDPFFMGMLAVFGLIYFVLILLSRVEIAVTIDGDGLSVIVREIVGRPIRERTHEISRHDVRKIRELALWGLAETVQIEGEDGRMLAQFPRFIEGEGHDAMIASILEWGDQSPSSLDAEAR